MFVLRSTEIPGCYEIQPRVLDDARGRFVKVFHRNVFDDQGLEVDFAEEYYSILAILNRRPLRIILKLN